MEKEEVIIIVFFWVLFAIIGFTLIDVRKELKAINSNLVQINQTMQEQNKIFNYNPEEDIEENKK